MKIKKISQTLKRTVATVSAAIVGLAVAPVMLEETGVVPDSVPMTPKAEAQAGSDLYLDTDANGFRGWTFVGDACGTVGASNVPWGKGCPNQNGWHGDSRLRDGWAQLTNTDRNGDQANSTVFWGGSTVAEARNLGNQSGSILYNQNIPAENGLKIEFEQVQGGGYLVQGWANGTGLIDPTRGADGIGFFLVNGDKTINLTRPGSYGASLGYAQGTADKNRLSGGGSRTLNSSMVEAPSRLAGSNEFSGTKYINPGVDNGVIGLGIDSFGNYASNKYGAGYGSSFPGYSLETVALANAGGRNGEVCVRNYHRGQGMVLADGFINKGPQGYTDRPSPCNWGNMYSAKQKADSFTFTLYNDPNYTGRNAMNTKKYWQNYLSYWEPRGDVLALRGPGNGVTGYPLLRTVGYGQAQGTQGRDAGLIPTSFGLTSFRSNAKDWSLVQSLAPVAKSLESNSAINPLTAASALFRNNTGLARLNDGWDKPPSNTYYKHFRVEIEPKVPGKSTVGVRVYASATKGDFSDPDAPKMETTIPASAISNNYKLGFSASTGAGTDVHAVRSVKVDALDKPSLKLEKYHQGFSGVNQKSTYAEGDTVPYRFKVTNTGNVNVGAVRVDDPALDSAAKCDFLDETGLYPGQSVWCTGSRRLTRDDLERSKPYARSSSDGGSPSFQSGWTSNSVFYNQARARGVSLSDYVSPVYSNIASATVPVNTSPKPKGVLDIAKTVKGSDEIKIDENGQATAKYYISVTNRTSEPAPIGEIWDYSLAPGGGAGRVVNARIRDVTNVRDEESVPFFMDGRPEMGWLLVSQNTSEMIPGYGNKLYEVQLDFQFDKAGVDRGEYDEYLRCQSSYGVFQEGYGGYNRAEPFGWADNWDPSGKPDNVACVNFTTNDPAKMSVSKTAHEKSKEINDDGTVSVFYDVTYRNTGGSPEVVGFLSDTPRDFGPGSRITGVYTDRSRPDLGFEKVGLWSGKFYPTEGSPYRELGPGDSVTYTVRVDYEFDLDVFDAQANEASLTCSGKDADRGAFNSVSTDGAWVDADGEANNSDCTTLTVKEPVVPFDVPIYLPATGGKLMWITAGSAVMAIVVAAAFAVGESRRKN